MFCSCSRTTDRVSEANSISTDGFPWLCTVRRKCEPSSAIRHSIPDALISIGHLSSIPSPLEIGCPVEESSQDKCGLSNPCAQPRLSDPGHASGLASHAFLVLRNHPFTSLSAGRSSAHILAPAASVFQISLRLEAYLCGRAMNKRILPGLRAPGPGRGLFLPAEVPACKPPGGSGIAPGIDHEP